MRDAHGRDCWGMNGPPEPWYKRLWRWFFPIKVKPFTTITIPQCFHTHDKREDLVKLMTETQPMSKDPDAV